MQKETLPKAVEQLNQALSAISDSVSQMAISLREVSAMVECHNKSEHFPFVSSDICDSEDAKLLNSVVAASAKDIVGGRQMDELDNKIAASSHQDKNSLESLAQSVAEDIIGYIAEQGGASLKDIGNWLDGCDNWTEETVRNFIEQNCPNLSVRDGFVFKNEVREAKPSPQRELNSELIMKYLKNKGGRATLKQIQSRFKGYLNNTCREIKSLVSRETNCIMVFNGKLSQCEVVLGETWNEGV